MYFPYLFGRQSELRALRALCPSYFATGNVVPVVEPVVKKTNDLIRCLAQLGAAEAPAIIILNPEQGEFKDGGAKAWRDEVIPTLKDHSSLLPALRCGPKMTITAATAFLKAFAKRDVALLYASPSFSDAELTQLVGASNVSYHICLQGKMKTTQRNLLPKTKAADIVDCFNKQARNADYSGTEFFTDSHRKFKKNGIGFGDYTVIGSIFQPGGGRPGAVAVHATYKHLGSKDIWVEHFVSDDTDINTGSAASKYLEAVSKVVSVTSSRTTEFGMNAALTAYADDDSIGHYPGLGKSKERQIYHHIAVMHGVLDGTL